MYIYIYRLYVICWDIHLFQSGSYPVLSNSSTVARPPEMTELLDTPLLKISQ